MVIPLDIALALVAAQVIAEHPDPTQQDRAADVLRSLQDGGSVGDALDTVVHSASSLNVPAHVSTQDWDDRDNG